MGYVGYVDYNDCVVLVGGGHVESVKYLLELGADPNSRGQFNRTPLYRSAFAGHMDCCEMLLQNGGDPRLYAEDGQNPENVCTIHRSGFKNSKRG